MTPAPEQFDENHTITLFSVEQTSRGQSQLQRELRPGDIIGGKYSLKSMLGRGGMGYVFRAEHNVLAREYALKVLAPEQLNQVAMSRFATEGKAIARMDNVNIVKVYDMGLDQGNCPYYVMDLLDGQSLSDYIEAVGPLPLDKALNILRQIAAGLAYAHGKGIVHRDMKPSNVVLLNADSPKNLTAKIVDFGIAKLLPSADLHSQSQTATGEIFGSPLYMSPEQSMGEVTDERSDIYSLGCTFYEMLAGSAPFRGENAMQTIMMHQTAAIPDPDDARQGKPLPEGVYIMLERMMAKRPEKRYLKMADLIHDVDRLVAGKPIGEAAVARSSREDSSEQSYLSNLTSAGIVIAKSAAVLALIGGIAYGGYVYYRQKTHVSEVEHIKVSANSAAKKVFTTDSTKGSGFDTPFTLNLTEALADKHHDDVKKALEAYKKIDKIEAVPVMVKGKPCLRMVFPEITMGVIIPNQIWDKRKSACGEVIFPADIPLSFSVGYLETDAVVQNPEQFAKISPTIFNRLRLERPDGSSIDSLHNLNDEKEVEDTGAIDRSMTKMVEIASGWPKLVELEFNNVHIAPSIYPWLDRFSLVNDLRFLNCGLEPGLADHIAKMKLETLMFQKSTDVKDIMHALANSKTLKKLRLELCRITPDTIKEISNCPSLEAVEIEANSKPKAPSFADGTSLTDLSIIGADTMDNWTDKSKFKKPILPVNEQKIGYSGYELVQPFKKRTRPIVLILRDKTLTDDQIRDLLSWPQIVQLEITDRTYGERRSQLMTLPGAAKLKISD